ncbi:hypothetical protein [Nonomuraea longicatena]|uniref:hypothetical protein n=1 Tax=Nonomuraea longicatena TaxID=83682 RepID=UPI0031D735F6
MAEYFPPRPAARAERKPRRGYALAVVVTGALLVFCAALPWAGLEARSDLIDAGIGKSLRGVDAACGVYTLLSGVLAVMLGLATLVTRLPLTPLAAIPGLAAGVLLVVFVTNPDGHSKGLTVALGDFLTIEPALKYGWFAALAAAVATTVFALFSLLPRRD